MSDVERLLTYDPGETTGWSFWLMDWDLPLQHVEHGMQKGGIHGFVEAFPEHQRRFKPTRIVSESFVLDGRTASPNVEPLRVEGALAALATVPYVLQRNTYKRHAPDELLEHHGFLWPGAGHDRDAARHAIAHAFTVGHPPTIEWVLGRMTY